MQLTIERKALLNALSAIGGIVQHTTKIPILEHMRLVATAGKLVLTGTDMESEIVEPLVADISSTGSLTVNAHQFLAIVRCLEGDGRISMQLGARNMLEIKGGAAWFWLPTRDAADYPGLPAESGAVTFTLAASDLERLIRKTRFAAATNETRVALNGISLQVGTTDKGQVLRMVATDSHRLARADCDLPPGAEGLRSVIVPRKACAALQKLLAGEAGAVVVAVGGRTLRVTIGERTLTVRLLEAGFPEYERIIPTDNANMIEMPVGLLCDAAERVASVKSRVLRLEAKGGAVTISAKSEDCGHVAEEEIAADHRAPITLGVNHQYLRDMAGAISGERLVLRCGSPGAAILVEDPADPATLQLVMPMRV